MGDIGAVVEAVAVAAGEDELLGGKRGEFLLERRRAETGEASEVAEVDFLIPAREKQAEDFRPSLGKEIGERVHCSLLVNDCLRKVNDNFGDGK